MAVKLSCRVKVICHVREENGRKKVYTAVSDCIYPTKSPKTGSMPTIQCGALHIVHANCHSCNCKGHLSRMTGGHYLFKLNLLFINKYFNIKYKYLLYYYIFILYSIELFLLYYNT